QSGRQEGCVQTDRRGRHQGRRHRVVEEGLEEKLPARRSAFPQVEAMSTVLPAAPPAGAAIKSVDEVLRNVSITRYTLEDFKPLTSSLGWQLSDLYWQ